MIEGGLCISYGICCELVIVHFQGLLGTVPDGFDEYFSSRFPRLLIEVYKVVCKYCTTEEWFQKYLQGTGL